MFPPPQEEKGAFSAEKRGESREETAGEWRKAERIFFGSTLSFLLSPALFFGPLGRKNRGACRSFELEPLIHAFAEYFLELPWRQDASATKLIGVHRPCDDVAWSDVRSDRGEI